MTYNINEKGYYGEFGGAYIPEMLYPNVEELRDQYLKIMAEPSFQEEFDQLLKDYAAAGRGTPSLQLVKLPEGHPYAVSGPGYYDYDGTSFSKTADLNMTPEYEKMLRLNDGLGQINQNTVPRKITQDDIDSANFFGPMMTGFDYSQPTNWSPGQPAPDGYRIAEIMGDKFLERMYPSKQEIAGLPGMIGPMGPMPLGLMMPPSGDYRDLYREDPQELQILVVVAVEEVVLLQQEQMVVLELL